MAIVPEGYHSKVRTKNDPVLSLDVKLLRPGIRLAVGLSGGADSVALLRALAERRDQLGLVLHAAHLHHGLRGAEADQDLEFCRALADSLDLPFHHARVDVAAEASVKSETLEEAARRLRYAWFRSLLAETPLDAIATAHTLDDQAETVLAKLLRGAWTEGLAGIHPVLNFPEGRILRPLLAVNRAEIEAYLGRLGQSWREDSSNRHLAFTRNRIRHELLPQLESWNPQLRAHLAAMAELAREEESWWDAEMARLAPQWILPGRPVRGGGRSSTGSAALSLDAARFGDLAIAFQRRLLRYAAGQLGSSLAYEATEELRSLALSGRAGQKRELAGGLLAERTHRELRLTAVTADTATAPLEIRFPIPGEITSSEFGLRIRMEAVAPGTAILRCWRAGDRVRLRYSGKSHKIKEVLERIKINGSVRAAWPVLEVDGRIVWMRGPEVEPEQGIRVEISEFDAAQSGPHPSGRKI